MALPTRLPKPWRSPGAIVIDGEQPGAGRRLALILVGSRPTCGGRGTCRAQVLAPRSDDVDVIAESSPA
jgi:hypothetical protein